MMTWRLFGQERPGAARCAARWLVKSAAVDDIRSPLGSWHARVGADTPRGTERFHKAALRLQRTRNFPAVDGISRVQSQLGR